MDKFTCTRFLIFLLIFYFWWCWVFAAPRGLCLVAESGASPCSCLPLLLGTQAQARRLRGLPHPGPGAPALTQTPSMQASGLVPSGFRTSGPRAQLPHSMGNLLGLEMEPCSLHGEANSYPLHCWGCPVTGILKFLSAKADIYLHYLWVSFYFLFFSPSSSYDSISSPASQSLI